MITRIAKILAVLLCVASVAFLGVSATVLTASYPWQRHMGELDRYVLQAKKTEAGVEYEMLKRKDGDTSTTTLQKSKNFPSVLVKAHQDLLTDLKAEQDAIDAEYPKLERLHNALKAAYDADVKALEKQKLALVAQQNRIDEEEQALADETLEVARDISIARNEQIARREDVERLKSQYSQIRADYTRAVEQRDKLEELLKRLNGQLTLLERRADFLQTQFESGLDPAYETGDESTETPES